MLQAMKSLKPCKKMALLFDLCTGYSEHMDICLKLQFLTTKLPA